MARQVRTTAEITQVSGDFDVYRPGIADASLDLQGRTVYHTTDPAIDLSSANVQYVVDYAHFRGVWVSNPLTLQQPIPYVIDNIVIGSNGEFYQLRNTPGVDGTQDPVSDNGRNWERISGDVLGISAWSSSVTYEFNNAVYDTNGNLYAYINGTPSSGNLLTDTTYWIAVGGAALTSSDFNNSGNSNGTSLAVDFVVTNGIVSATADASSINIDDLADVPAVPTGAANAGHVLAVNSAGNALEWVAQTDTDTDTVIHAEFDHTVNVSVDTLFGQRQIGFNNRAEYVYVYMNAIAPIAADRPVTIIIDGVSHVFSRRDGFEAFDTDEDLGLSLVYTPSENHSITPDLTRTTTPVPATFQFIELVSTIGEGDGINFARVGDREIDIEVDSSVARTSQIPTSGTVPTDWDSLQRIIPGSATVIQLVGANGIAPPTGVTSIAVGTYVITTSTTPDIYLWEGPNALTVVPGTNLAFSAVGWRKVTNRVVDIDDLGDVPDVPTGIANAGQVLAVNAAGDGLEWVEQTDTDTTYTFNATSNSGTTLGVDFTTTGTTITGTVDASSLDDNIRIQDSGIEEHTSIETINFNENLNVTVNGTVATIDGAALVSSQILRSTALIQTGGDRAGQFIFDTEAEAMTFFRHVEGVRHVTITVNNVAYTFIRSNERIFFYIGTGTSVVYVTSQDITPVLTDQPTGTEIEVLADLPVDRLLAGDNVSLTYDSEADSLTIAATDTGSDLSVGVSGETPIDNVESIAFTGAGVTSGSTGSVTVQIPGTTDGVVELAAAPSMTDVDANMFVRVPDLADRTNDSVWLMRTGATGLNISNPPTTANAVEVTERYFSETFDPLIIDTTSPTLQSTMGNSFDDSAVVELNGIALDNGDWTSANNIITVTGFFRAGEEFTVRGILPNVPTPAPQPDVPVLSAGLEDLNDGIYVNDSRNVAPRWMLNSDWTSFYNLRTSLDPLVSAMWNESADDLRVDSITNLREILPDYWGLNGTHINIASSPPDGYVFGGQSPARATLTFPNIVQTPGTMGNITLVIRANDPSQTGHPTTQDTVVFNIPGGDGSNNIGPVLVNQINNTEVGLNAFAAYDNFTLTITGRTRATNSLVDIQIINWNFEGSAQPDPVITPVDAINTVFPGHNVYSDRRIHVEELPGGINRWVSVDYNFTANLNNTTGGTDGLATDVIPIVKLQQRPFKHNYDTSPHNYPLIGVNQASNQLALFRYVPGTPGTSSEVINTHEIRDNTGHNDFGLSNDPTNGQVNVDGSRSLFVNQATQNGLFRGTTAIETTGAMETELDMHTVIRVNGNIETDERVRFFVPKNYTNNGTGFEFIFLDRIDDRRYPAGTPVGFDDVTGTGTFREANVTVRAGDASQGATTDEIYVETAIPGNHAAHVQVELYFSFRTLDTVMSPGTDAGFTAHDLPNTVATYTAANPGDVNSHNIIFITGGPPPSAPTSTNVWISSVVVDGVLVQSDFDTGLPVGLFHSATEGGINGIQQIIFGDVNDDSRNSLWGLKDRSIANFAHLQIYHPSNYINLSGTSTARPQPDYTTAFRARDDFMNLMTLDRGQAPFYDIPRLMQMEGPVVRTDSGISIVENVRAQLAWNGTAYAWSIVATHEPVALFREATINGLSTDQVVPEYYNTRANEHGNTVTYPEIIMVFEPGTVPSTSVDEYEVTFTGAPAAPGIALVQRYIERRPNGMGGMTQGRTFENAVRITFTTQIPIGAGGLLSVTYNSIDTAELTILT